MNNEILCPWCNSEMVLISETIDERYDSACMQCPKCYAHSPVIRTYNNNINGILEQTIALAKERWVEPNKVLTMEDVDKSFCIDKPVYLELKDFGGVRWVENANQALNTIRNMRPIRYIGDCYGSMWRCWLRKPTVEERSAVPWKEQPTP